MLFFFGFVFGFFARLNEIDNVWVVFMLQNLRMRPE